MKTILFTFFLISSLSIFGQEEQVDIPKGVVYRYCDSNTYENAKAIIKEELGSSPKYSLSNKLVFIGPVLWARYQRIDSLTKIKGGNLTLLGYKKSKSFGKVLQTKKDFKLLWDHLREEIGNKDFKLRKANFSELKYYWSVISFEIEESLIIIETEEHNYILNLLPKNFKLFWLDESPLK
jgi:hypothetical protein